MSLLRNAENYQRKGDSDSLLDAGRTRPVQSLPPSGMTARTSQA
jgi:hypothetical protein